MLTSFPCCVSSCNSFSPTDNKFATCSDDGTVRIWDFLRCHEERILRGMFSKKYWLEYFRKGKLFSCPIRTVQISFLSKVWHHFLNPSESYVTRISKFSTIHNLTLLSHWSYLYCGYFYPQHCWNICLGIQTEILI